jgi:hypothetical protein
MNAKMRHAAPFLRRATLSAAVWLAALAGPLVAQTADNYTLPVVKRYFMVQADARCHLLDEATSRALKAGYLQARNDALRAGLSMSYLSPWLARARDAAARTACDSPQLTTEVETAKNGFRRYMAVPHLDLNSGRADWAADRAYGDDVVWRLVQYQNTDKADMALGVFGSLHTNSFSLMAHFKDGTHPYAARLMVRNTDMMPTGLIDRTPYDLTRQMPRGFSDVGSLSFMASNMSDLQADLHSGVKTNMAGFTVTGQYAGTRPTEDAIRFDFPSRAWIAIAKLDPREDIVVEFSTDEGPVYGRFEVGDFVTGLTYVALPSAYTNIHVNTAS